MRAKNLPVTPSASGEEASHTAVSAPFSGDLNSSFCAFEASVPKPVSRLTVMLVPTMPGFAAFTITPVPANFSARAYVNMTPASFDCE